MTDWRWAERIADKSELTVEEVIEIQDLVANRFTDRENGLLFLYEKIIRQYARGHRCGVCGMTGEQSFAAGYDCIREC